LIGNLSSEKPLQDIDLAHTELVGRSSKPGTAGDDTMNGFAGVSGIIGMRILVEVLVAGIPEAI
jgi:hypothetical protein